MTILLTQPDQAAKPIPEWMTDLQSFRKWACSDEFPQAGSYSHLDGNLWVDNNVEIFAHNQVKGKIGNVLTTLVDDGDKGKFMGDRMLLTNVQAGLATEPDGMYVSHDSLAAGRAELALGQDSKELIGTPDMVLEVVSRTSKHKDRVVLRELYHRAKIPEYWIVEPYSKHTSFDLLEWTTSGYVEAPVNDGWVRSQVFGKEFRITMTTDRSGLAVYHLEVR